MAPRITAPPAGGDAPGGADEPGSRSPGGGIASSTRQRAPLPPQHVKGRRVRCALLDELGGWL